MRKPRELWTLIIGILGISGLGWFINSYAPNSAFTIFLFFVGIFLSFYPLFFYTTNNVRRAMLLTLGVLCFFLLRFVHLRHFFYIILLTASLISLEVYFQKR